MGLIKYQARQGRPAFLDTFFDDFFTRDRFFNDLMSEGNFKPAANIIEQEKGFEVELAVPGFEKGDFNIEINSGVLSVSGSKSQAETREENKFTLREYTARQFTRSFTLPENIDEGQIEASYKDGILKMHLPKRNEAPVSTKKIQIQ